MKSAGHVLLLCLSAAAYGLLAYQVPRHEFLGLAGLLGLCFGLYVVLLRTGLSLRLGLGAALVLRLLWLPALPALSDDYYRFRWDGLLVAHGVNPYQFRPEELVAPVAPVLLPPAVQRELRQLYPRLNSPRYYSVYPPVGQGIFAGAARVFPASLAGFALALRVVVLLAEAATAGMLLALLRAFGQPPRRALWYLLNPLVIVELTGNLHFEALVVCFLLLMLWLLERGRATAAGGALGLAVATKLLPLLVLPLLGRRLRSGARWGFGLGLGVVLLSLFAPFLSGELLTNIGRSLNLYFRSFEFNASVYYLLRALGQWYYGYNPIARLGPLLALATAATGLLLAATERRPTWAGLPRALLLLLSVYFLLATTVHPWYLTPLVALSVFTRARYALVWSGLAVLSYAAYRTTAYTESLGLVALEYGVVLGVLALDVWRGRLSGLPAAA